MARFNSTGVLLCLTTILAACSGGRDSAGPESRAESDRPSQSVSGETAKPTANPITELLAAWSESRGPVPDDPIRTMAEKGVVQARTSGNAAQYLFAVQLYVSGGDLVRAKAVLDEVASLAPNVDGPHFALADLYYRLGMFDAVRRDLLRIDKVPTGDVSAATLAAGHLKLEIDELLGDGKPQAYRVALQKAGFNEKDEPAINAYLIAIDPTGLSPEARAFLPELVGKAGRPTYLPIPDWQPDSRNKEVLLLAQSEMRAAQVSATLAEPRGMRVIDRHRMKTLHARIDSLVSQ